MHALLKGHLGDSGRGTLNIKSDPLSRVEDSGITDLAGFLAKLPSRREGLGAKVSSVQKDAR